MGDSGRVPALDGLRGVAILLVLAGHAHVLPIDTAGPVGVTVFFVLSGYLITGLLLRDIDHFGGIRWRRFYVRRAARLLPALGLLLAALWVVFLALDQAAAHRRETALTVGYVYNWWKVGTGSDGPLGHMWSLAVEEQFYLLWPVALGLLARGLPRPQMARLTVVAAVTLAGWRVALDVGSAHGWAMYGTDANASALLAGAALAMLPRLMVRRWVTFAAWVTLAAACLLPTSTEVAAQVIATCAAVAIVASPIGLAALPLRALGRISYGVYLWHYPLLLASGLALWQGYAATLAVAALSWWLIEEPIRRRATRLGVEGNHERDESGRPTRAVSA